VGWGQWQSLLFLIPLGVGGLLALGAALGVMGEGDGHHDGDGDGDGDDGSTWLALGKVPVTVRLMLLTVPFGSLGLATTHLLGQQTGGWRVLVAAAVAVLGTWAVAGRVARLFRDRVRMVETETISRRELVGGVGRAVLGIGAASGLAQVKDRRGNLHQVSCRTLDGEVVLRAGAEVLVVDYDEEGKVFYVTGNPGA
jgi:hypothetical protein